MIGDAGRRLPAGECCRCGMGSSYSMCVAHVYVHIPFCLQKCLYCDFNSYPISSLRKSYPDIIDLYIKALIREATMIGLCFRGDFPAGVANADEDVARGYADVPRREATPPPIICGDTLSPLEGRLPRAYDDTEPPISEAKVPMCSGIRTIYIGGGTPTTVPPDLLLSSINECIRQIGGRAALDGPGAALPEAVETEITVEVNPATVDLHSLRLLKAQGVNRLSIGVQSFDDHILKVLGRIHTSAEAAETIHMSRKAGFLNVNVDLIYGCPEQTLRDFENDLKRCVAFTPEHISAYALTLSDEVPLKSMVDRGTVTLPDDDLVADMADLAHDFLGSAGYEHYEISNWALPGFRCRHNLNYWKRGSYLGLGAGAHSHVDGVRWWNVRDPWGYIARLGRDILAVEGMERLAPDERMSELMILGLRLLEDGVGITDFREETGMWPEEAFPGVLENLMGKGLVEMADDGRGRRLRLTGAARNVANRVFVEFVGMRGREGISNR